MRALFAQIGAALRNGLARVSQVTLACVALTSLLIGRLLGMSGPERHPLFLDLVFDLLAAAFIALLALRAYRSNQREKRYQSLAETRAVALINTSAELVQATQSEKEAQAARLQAERSYRSIFDNASEGIFQTSPNGHYLNANPALARLYGYDTPEDLMAGLTNIAGQLYVDPSRRSAFRTELLSTDRVSDFVSQIRRRDGSTIWISENARAVRDETGELLYYEGTVEDVTGRLEAEQTIRAALAEAEQASRAKVAFLAAMSHELRTPLNAVIGFSEILKDERLGAISLRKYVEFASDIHANGQRLLQRINDILDLTRIEGGGVSLDLEEISLHMLLDDAAKLAHGAQDAPASALAPLRIHAPESLPMVVADRRKMRQVLKNLIDNAFKFTPESGTISICVHKTHAGLDIAIEDTGIGMIPERIPVALEPFKQLDSSLARRFEGIGLGLPIARALTTLHGGQLRIESRPTIGTVVTVSLPNTMLCEGEPTGAACQYA